MTGIVYLRGGSRRSGAGPNRLRMRSYWWTKLAGSVGFRIALKPLSRCVKAVALDLSDLTDLGGWPFSNGRVRGHALGAGDGWSDTRRSRSCHRAGVVCGALAVSRAAEVTRQLFGLHLSWISCRARLSCGNECSKPPTAAPTPPAACLCPDAPRHRTGRCGFQCCCGTGRRFLAGRSRCLRGRPAQLLPDAPALRS